MQLISVTCYSCIFREVKLKGKGGGGRRGRRRGRGRKGRERGEGGEGGEGREGRGKEERERGGGKGGGRRRGRGKGRWREKGRRVFPHVTTSAFCFLHTANVTLEQTSNLIASTTPGGSVTLNCTLNTTGLQVHWWYMNAHELPDDTSINIESIKFQRRSHINYTINTYPLGNEMVHSITLENLAESDNYAMVACVMDQPPCSTKPPHPFVLLVNGK